MYFYIDPGTGSMLFTILIGVLSAAIYLLRNVVIKLRFAMSGGRQKSADAARIPFVLFTDDKRYWNTFQPICDELERRGQTAVYMTASPDDPALKQSYAHVRTEFIGQGNRAFARMNTLKADVVLATTPGLEVYQWKRSRDARYYMHILHMPNDATLYRMFGLDYFDAVLLTGEYQVRQLRKLEALRKLPEKELPLVGLPYLDRLRARLNEAGPAPEHPVTVLLAPSWGPSGLLTVYGKKLLDALLKTPYHIVVRPHPQSFVSEKPLMDELMAAYPDSERLEWDRSNDNFEVLRRSDVMISDFSGVIFDFALVFDGPVIYSKTEFDKGPYDAWWLDDELWTFSILEKIGVQLNEGDFANLGAVIDRCLNAPGFREGREQARRETWANIGHSAEATVDFMMKTRERLLNPPESNPNKDAA
ncbi:MAG: CDP-glycerol glycerophosphotransferase family protein [Clostridia bacterium]|nr:CDP-glycerol glycerophosphotransferase family protein [Clostridia bacterium]